MPEKVKSHTHVTPRVYLRRFAAGGELMTELHGGESRLIGVPEVAVRKRFYTLRTSSGVGSNEVEDSLAVLEGAVTSAFDAIDRDEFPLKTAAKAVLAEFIATQMCRGVAYRDMREKHIQQSELWLRGRVRTLFEQHAPESLMPQADAYVASYDLSKLSDQNTQVRAALDTSHLLANALVNMRWTVVTFDRPRLLSSDQPVVCWRGSHFVSPWMPLTALEIRVPLSPTQGLVASWHDGVDPASVIGGGLLDALSFNHYTSKQAVDWVYWLPETKPRSGQPLHDDGIVGPWPASSRRRDLVTKLIAHHLDHRKQTITVFTPPTNGHG